MQTSGWVNEIDNLFAKGDWQRELPEVFNLHFGNESFGYKIWRNETLTNRKKITCQLFRPVNLNKNKIVENKGTENNNNNNGIRADDGEEKQERGEFKENQIETEENEVEEENAEEITLSKNEEDFEEEEEEGILTGEIQNLKQLQNEEEEKDIPEAELSYFEMDKLFINYRNEINKAANRQNVFDSNNFSIAKNETIIMSVCSSNCVSENEIFIVLPKDISNFIKLHKEHVFLVENCVEFFKTTRHFLCIDDDQRSNVNKKININKSKVYSEKDEWLWEMVNENRLVDLQIAEILLKLAEKNAPCRPSPVINIIKNRTGVKISTFIESTKKKIKNMVEEIFQSCKIEDETTITSNEYEMNEGEVCADENNRHVDIIFDEERREEVRKKNTTAIFQSIFNIQVLITIGMKNAYLVIENKSRHLLSYYSNLVYPNSEKMFGLLTQSIQVKSALSASFMSNNGITLYHRDIVEVYDNINSKIEQTVKELQDLEVCRNLFYFDPITSSLRTINEYVKTPLINLSRLQEILFYIQSYILYHHNLKIPPLFVHQTLNREATPNSFESNFVHIRLMKWKCYSHMHPFIPLWITFQSLNYYLGSVSSFITEIVKTTNTHYPSPYHFIESHRYLLQYPHISPQNFSFSKKYLHHDRYKYTVLHPQWRYLIRNGRMACSSPRVTFTPKDFQCRSLVKPRPGNVLLVIDYSYIELCTFSAVCEHRYGYSNLGKVIRSGTDPHSYTSSLFLGVEITDFLNGLKPPESALHSRSSEGEGNQNSVVMMMERNEDEEKRKCEDMNFLEMRNLAKIMNFAVASGIGSRSLCQLINNVLSRKMKIEEVKLFRDKLKNKIYPEMSLHLFINITEVLAKNLGESISNVVKISKYNRKYNEHYIRRLIQGRISKESAFYDEIWVSNFFQSLYKLNKNKELEPYLRKTLKSHKGSQTLYEKLYRCTETTPTGRIRSNLSFLQRNNYPFCGLASDGAKLALWDLIHSGYRVIGFIHDEFLIELPARENNDYLIEAKLAESIVCGAMSKIVPSVPISSKYYISNSWSIIDTIT